jgi:hypothetical protein
MVTVLLIGAGLLLLSGLLCWLNARHLENWPGRSVYVDTNFGGAIGISLGCGLSCFGLVLYFCVL